MLSLGILFSSIFHPTLIFLLFNSDKSSSIIFNGMLYSICKIEELSHAIAIFAVPSVLMFCIKVLHYQNQKVSCLLYLKYFPFLQETQFPCFLFSCLLYLYKDSFLPALPF